MAITNTTPELIPCRFDGVHVLRAGLWGRRANITLASDQGDWGKVFREAVAGEGTVPAYNVKVSSSSGDNAGHTKGALMRPRVLFAGRGAHVQHLLRL